jgi:hypothetical protein
MQKKAMSHANNARYAQGIGDVFKAGAAVLWQVVWVDN